MPPRAKHDKTMKHDNPVMVRLPSDHPEYSRLAEVGKCALQCNVCGFVSEVKDTYGSIWGAGEKAKEAHQQTTQLVPWPGPSASEPRCANALAFNTDAASNSNPVCFNNFRSFSQQPPSAQQLAAQFAPMDIDGFLGTSNRRAETSTTTDRGVVRKQITRHVQPNGSAVEHEIFEERKDTTIQRQVEEYQATISRLQSNCKTLDTKWTEATDECQRLKAFNTGLGDTTGMATCEAIMRNKPGAEFSISLLLISRLLMAIEALKKDASAFEASCRDFPVINVRDPFVKQLLKERGGVEAYRKLLVMTDEEYAAAMPNLNMVGATPDLLRTVGILPSSAKADAPTSTQTFEESGPEYFPDPTFKTDYPLGKLPSLKKEPKYSSVWSVQSTLTNWIHLHLTREDGERPTLLAILNDNYRVQRTLPQRDYEIAVCFVAYECEWEHPSKKTFKCHVSEDLVLRHYPTKVREYKRRYGIA